MSPLLTGTEGRSLSVAASTIAIAPRPNVQRQPISKKMTRGLAQTARSPERHEFWDCATAQHIAEDSAPKPLQPRMPSRGDETACLRGVADKRSTISSALGILPCSL